MSSKSHTHKRCGTLRKNSFSARGYAEINTKTYKDRFLTIKIAHKNSWIENPNGENMLYCLLYT
jgi:hypothetical protein